jgi:hypothetical protein
LIILTSCCSKLLHQMLQQTLLKDNLMFFWPCIMNWLYINYQLLMHWLLFIHKILFSSTCFEPQVLTFRRIWLYTCSIWYCLGGCLIKTPTNNLPPPVSSHSSCVPTGHQELS